MVGRVFAPCQQTYVVVVNSPGDSGDGRVANTPHTTHKHTPTPRNTPKHPQSEVMILPTAPAVRQEGSTSHHHDPQHRLTTIYFRYL